MYVEEIHKIFIEEYQMRIVNLCPSPIKIERMVGSEDESIIVFKSHAAQYGINLTVEKRPAAPDFIDNIVVTPVDVNLSAKLPNPQEGICYLVPKEIASLYIGSGRNDIVYPDYPDQKSIAEGKLPTYQGLFQFR
jgi:hypothetical protein